MVSFSCSCVEGMIEFGNCVLVSVRVLRWRKCVSIGYGYHSSMGEEICFSLVVAVAIVVVIIVAGVSMKGRKGPNGGSDSKCGISG